MNDARLMMMSGANNSKRIARIGDLTAHLEITEHDGMIRPLVKFSEPLVFTEEARMNLVGRLYYIFHRSEDEGLSIQEIETDITKFVQTLLLHYVIMFDGEREYDRSVEMYKVPEDEDFAATTD